MSLLLLAGKILWNFATLYVGVYARRRGRIHGGVSLMPWIEVVLLGAAVAWADDCSRWISAGQMFLWGGAGVLLSYVHLLVGAALIRRSEARRGRTSSRHHDEER